MSDKADLLIEIGCEEIPARMLPQAARDLAERVTGLLDGAGLEHGEARAYWTPRRLASLIPAVSLSTAASSETVVGPPASVAWDADGNLTRAASGFASKQGVDPSSLQRVETERGVYAAAVVERPPLDVGDVLAAGFERAVAGMTFPKTMTWGDGTYTFVRPVHWLVALAGDRVLPLRLFGLEAGRVSRGHRVLSGGEVSIPSAAAWADALAAANVHVDPVERREVLDRVLAGCAAEAGGTLVPDPELLAEVSDMVEVPAALTGRFDRKFVSELPAEVLRTCLKHHQKAFSVESGEGRLPVFAVAVNMTEDPEGHIRRGHEWVVSGRLEDALFFWREDRRRTLADRLPELEGVVFHEKLGTYAAKTARVRALCRWLAGQAGLDENGCGTLDRAAQLARCDLVTGLVGEFPELQGVVGGLLARADGEDPGAAVAMASLYRPAGTVDDLPGERAARLLGIADRADTLTGGFGAGLVPSGSKDPFALRRAGTALLRLAAAEDGLQLGALVDQAIEQFESGAGGDGAGAGAREARGTLIEFLLDRFGMLAEREGARYDEIAAVRAVAEPRLDAADMFRRVRALAAFRDSEDFLALAVASKRVRNILAQAEERGDPVEIGHGAGGLDEPSAIALHEEVGRAEADLAGLLGRADYEAALGRLAATRPAVDRFFDDVLVMDPDPGRRAARLGLLARLNQLARDVVDLSQLVVEGA